MDALLGAYDAIAAGSARVALVVTADALVPGPGTSYEERAGAGAAAIVLVSEGGNASLPARVTRTHPFLDRYRSDGDDGTRDLYDARLFREEIFLPVVQEVGEQLPRSRSTSGRSPTPTAASAQRPRASSEAARPPRRVCTRPSATRVRPPRSWARSARS